MENILCETEADEWKSETQFLTHHIQWFYDRLKKERESALLTQEEKQMISRILKLYDEHFLLE